MQRRSDKLLQKEMIDKALDKKTITKSRNCR